MPTLDEIHAKLQSAYLTGQMQLADDRSDYETRLANGILSEREQIRDEQRILDLRTALIVLGQKICWVSALNDVAEGEVNIKKFDKACAKLAAMFWPQTERMPTIYCDRACVNYLFSKLDLTAK